jgi:hypothetical protein
VWEALRWLLSEQTLSELCLCPHFQFFFWKDISKSVFKSFSSSLKFPFVWRHFIVFVVSLDEGGGVWGLIPTTGFTLMFTFQIISTIQSKGIS